MKATDMAARVEERIWTAEGSRKRAAVQGMFAEIAPTYDLLNGLMSFSMHHRWRALAVKTLKLQPGDHALDVCCGTGDFVLALEKVVGKSGFVAGIDFCAPMLEQAAKKVDKNVLTLGDACNLPVANESFSGVTVGWGIRNVPDIDAAHQEIARVLRPGGRFVSLDMARPRNPLMRAMSEFIFNTLVPKLGTLFGKTQAYTYLPKSTQRFKTREELAASMESAGLVDVGHRDLMFGNICLHFGRKPLLGETRA